MSGNARESFLFRAPAPITLAIDADAVVISTETVRVEPVQRIFRAFANNIPCIVVY